MASVEIFNFSIYDVQSDQAVRSKRMGTRQAIEMIRGIIDHRSGVRVDDNAIQSDIYGLTVINYVPEPYSGGFPTQLGGQRNYSV